MSRYWNLRDAITDLTTDPDLLALLDEARLALDAGLDPEVRVKLAETLGRDLLAIREQRIALAQVEASVESVLARVMPVPKLDFGDLHLERKGGRDRKEWDHDGLVAALAREFATNEAGETDDTLLPLYGEAVRHYLRAAQVSGYRTKTGLVPLGIDPDDYSKSERGRRTVHVTGPVEVAS